MLAEQERNRASTEPAAVPFRSFLSGSFFFLLNESFCIAVEIRAHVLALYNIPSFPCRANEKTTQSMPAFSRLWVSTTGSAFALGDLLSLPVVHHCLVFLAEGFRASLVCRAVDAARAVDAVAIAAPGALAGGE